MAFLTLEELNRLVTHSHLAFYSRGDKSTLSQGAVFLQGQAVDGLVYSVDDIDHVVATFPELQCAKWDRPRFIRHTKKAELLFTQDTVMLEFNEAEAVEDIIQESLQ